MDGTTLVSGSWDKTLKTWDLRTGSLIRTFKGTSIIYSLAVLASGLVATGQGDGKILIWDTDKKIDVGSLEHHSGSV